MAQASDDHCFVRNHRMKLDVGRYVHERTNREIHQASAKPLQTFKPGDVMETQLDFGMGAPEEFHIFRQHVKNRGPASGDLNPALVDFGASLFELLIQVFQLLDERPGHFKKQFPVVSELDF